ncbi:MAG: helix-turn-helix domain-containing protein [Synechococcales cyanobacterium T60_A2020_003]|nr:helix-turn-helix domain-containing protein [Synechococcales cyanobacterium T60_A2020_003]
MMYTPQLRSHMASVGIPSFKALSRAAEVSEWQVLQLRQGKADQMRAEVLSKLGRVLGRSLDQLVQEFSSLEVETSSAAVSSIEAVQQEYQRLQTQLEQQKIALSQDLQRQVLQILETLLLQLPTAAYAAQQNPDLPAQRLLPLLKPIDQLLQKWGVEAIAPVGAEIPYDPKIHQLLEGTANVGDRVRIRYIGYRQGETLLYRAKVSPVSSQRQV